MFLVSGIDFVAPLARLTVQILPTGESAPRQKVGFDEPERSFYPPGAIRVSHFVSHEVKAEALSKGRHFRHSNHIPSRTPHHPHIRALHHHPSRFPPKPPHLT